MSSLSQFANRIGSSITVLSHGKIAFNKYMASAINKLKIAVLSYEQGKLDVLGSMSSPCTDCPAVEVSNETTSITLYNPTNVNFRKVTK